MIEYVNQDEKDLIQVIKLSINTSIKEYGKIVFSEHRKGLYGEIISKDSIIYIPKKVYMTMLLNALKEGVL